MNLNLPFDLIVTDMDGTLLNEKHLISPRTLKALKRYQSMGGLITLATGRMEQAILHYVEQIEINCPLILYNGAKIVSIKNKVISILMERMLSYEKACQMVLFMKNECKDKDIIVYSQSQSFVFRQTPSIIAHFNKEKVPYTVLDTDDIPKPITKLLIIDSNRQYEEIKRKAKMIFGDQLNSVHSEPEYWEILPEKVDKGNGLTWLVDYMGIDMKRVIAFGDQLNDIPLLKAAGVGIAMGNAAPQLKEVAKQVTADNTQDGLARIVEKLILNRFNN